MTLNQALLQSAGFADDHTAVLMRAQAAGLDWLAVLKLLIEEGPAAWAILKKFLDLLNPPV